MSLECINALYYSNYYLGLSSDLRHSGLTFEHWPQTHLYSSIWNQSSTPDTIHLDFLNTQLGTRDRKL